MISHFPNWVLRGQAHWLEKRTIRLCRLNWRAEGYKNAQLGKEAASFGADRSAVKVEKFVPGVTPESDVACYLPGAGRVPSVVPFGTASPATRSTSTGKTGG